MNVLFEYLIDKKKRFSDSVAIVCGENKLTFNDLYISALNMSKVLVEKKVLKQPVFIYLPKNEKAIIAMMGVLASGNFYTPTDVNFPIERPKRIYDSLNPEVVITDSKNWDKCIKMGISTDRMINMDELELFDPPKEKYIVKAISEDLAYVLFTSGSTGTPKGVMITRGAVADYIEWVANCFEISNSDSICNQAPFYFDNSTLDIYTMLKCGATLHLVPENYFSFPAKLAQYLVEKRITTIFWVPSVFQSFQRFDLLAKVKGICLEKILFAGEVMHNRELNYWRKWIKGAVFANLYGPTEITVDCTYYIVDREFGDDEPLPIGKARDNMEVFLLDKSGNKIEEINIKGEICVRGYSLSKGYWNDIEKTKKVFVQNPVNKFADEKIYRTGDIGHYNSDGNIMFDGRLDNQIKHKGCRIELGEIDNMALIISDIQQVCTLYDPVKEILIMFLVVKEQIEERVISKKLREILPNYMIPEKIIIIEDIPLNDNGKYDRKKLLSMLEEKNDYG